jgi:hypothetical protein
MIIHPLLTEAVLGLALSMRPRLRLEPCRRPSDESVTGGDDLVADVDPRAGREVVSINPGPPG